MSYNVQTQLNIAENAAIKTASAEQDYKIVVCALYKFVALDDFKLLQSPFKDRLHALNIRGTLLLANEGINGTIAGTKADVLQFIHWLQLDERFSAIDFKFSFHRKAPFHRTKVKLKEEIVTMGVEGINPNELVGSYVDAQDWNELIKDPDTVLIDTRNEYEVEIGSFANAINPHTETFREFPDYVEQNLSQFKDKKIAMFCTGGIRCEKASAYMRQQGFDEVFHLKGGVLNYLETVNESESLWNGECFVFDDRVAVNHVLEKGSYDQCHACRYPITEQQKQSPHYSAGVSCPRCYQHLSAQQRKRFAEREKQVQLANRRGEAHIGIDSALAAASNKIEKQQLKSSQRVKIS